MATSKIESHGDFVIEQGTSGIWTYRKWRSGIKECWCNTTTGSSYSMEANGALYSSTPNFELALPSGLFSETPCVQLMVRTGGGMWLKATGGTTASTLIYQVLRTNTTVVSLNVSIYCIGK